MNEKTVKRFRNFKGIKRVNKQPNFILKLKGKWNAKRGQAIALRYIERLKTKCRALENDEVSTAELILSSYRKEGASILASMCNDKDILGCIPGNKDSTSAMDARINKRNANKRASTVATIKAAYDKLVQLNEVIININVHLVQRILKTRHICSEKINAYVIGVCEIIPDFEFDNTYVDIATNVYREMHMKGDAAISKAVETIYGGGTNDDEMV